LLLVLTVALAGEAAGDYAKLVLEHMAGQEHSCHGSPRDYDRIEGKGGADVHGLTPSLKRAVMDATVDARQALAGPPRKLRGASLHAAVVQRVVALTESEAGEGTESLDAAVAREMKQEAQRWHVEPQMEADLKQELLDEIMEDLLMDTVSAVARLPGLEE
jgi:hypothetical protein